MSVWDEENQEFDDISSKVEAICSNNPDAQEECACYLQRPVLPFSYQIFMVKMQENTPNITLESAKFIRPIGFSQVRDHEEAITLEYRLVVKHTL